MLEVLKQNQGFSLGEEPQSPDVILICQDGRLLTHRYTNVELLNKRKEIGYLSRITLHLPQMFAPRNIYI